MADSPWDDRLIGLDISSTSTIRFQEYFSVVAIADENDRNFMLDNSFSIKFVSILILFRFWFCFVLILMKNKFKVSVHRCEHYVT